MALTVAAPYVSSVLVAGVSLQPLPGIAGVTTIGPLVIMWAWAGFAAAVNPLTQYGDLGLCCTK